MPSLLTAHVSQGQSRVNRWREGEDSGNGSLLHLRPFLSALCLPVHLVPPIACEGSITVTPFVDEEGRCRGNAVTQLVPRAFRERADTGGRGQTREPG